MPVSARLCAEAMPWVGNMVSKARKVLRLSPKMPWEGREVLYVTIFYNFNGVSFSMRETLAKRV